MKPGGLLEAIVELSHERGLEQESIIEAIEDAIVGAAYRKYKNYKNIEAALNLQTGEIDLMHYKVVVENVQDHDNEISMDEVVKLDPAAECGDEVEYEIDSKEFAPVIAQTARQLIFQKIREAERESVMEKYSEKKGEIVHGTVSRIERGRVIITIANSVEAVLEYREQIPFEKLQQGEHVRVYLLDLCSEGRGPQLIVSRTHPDFLMKLFEVEVPEVYDGIIEVVGAAREPGKRAKVAVFTNDPDVDPVGACVGMRGSRVQTIVSELCGERIDVIEWSEDLEQYMANALAPADIVEIDLHEENRVADIKIAQDQLSLAIGKQGQNVRLASKLTGVMININAWEPPDLGKLDKEEPDEKSEASPTSDEASDDPERDRSQDDIDGDREATSIDEKKEPSSEDASSENVNIQPTSAEKQEEPISEDTSSENMDIQPVSAEKQEEPVPEAASSENENPKSPSPEKTEQQEVEKDDT
ncbi:MAG: transcription termination factor NusA [Proteobacteria bacterium]|nr:transcription termination factor NusA [Pseudomonadota bacterium]